MTAEGRHRQPVLTRWAWDWGGGKRSLSLPGWILASWALCGVLWLGLTLSDRTWHTDTTWVTPDRATLTERESR